MRKNYNGDSAGHFSGPAALNALALEYSSIDYLVLEVLHYVIGYE